MHLSLPVHFWRRKYQFDNIFLHLGSSCDSEGFSTHVCLMIRNHERYIASSHLETNVVIEEESGLRTQRPRSQRLVMLDPLLSKDYDHSIQSVCIALHGSHGPSDIHRQRKLTGYQLGSIKIRLHILPADSQWQLEIDDAYPDFQ